MTEIRSLKVRATENGATQIRPSGAYLQKICITQIGTPQIGITQIRFSQVRFSQVCPPQIGLCKISAMEVDTTEVSAVKISDVEVWLDSLYIRIGSSPGIPECFS
ncbi:MAG: hypothetical protein PVSMB5_25870 [Ktedonobacteraceae bacterium]